jgi:hypothetical protein
VKSQRYLRTLRGQVSCAASTTTTRRSAAAMMSSLAGAIQTLTHPSTSLGEERSRARPPRGSGLRLYTHAHSKALTKYLAIGSTGVKACLPHRPVLVNATLLPLPPDVAKQLRLRSTGDLFRNTQREDVCTLVRLVYLAK